MITNPENTVFTCLLISKINPFGEKFQIMIILNTIEIKIFKLIKSNLFIDKNKNEKVKFIFLTNIINNTNLLKTF